MRKTTFSLDTSKLQTLRLLLEELESVGLILVAENEVATACVGCDSTCQGTCGDGVKSNCSSCKDSCGGAS